MTEQELINFRNEDFLSKEILSLINDLSGNEHAEWGIMSAQHMIEHLTGSFRISNGDIVLEPKTVENLSGKKEFLHSDKGFKRGILTSGTTEPKLRNLKFETLEEAKADFFKHLIAFFSHFEQHPEDEFYHPAFGKCDYKDWLQFHYKHVRHHLSQFGLING